MSDEFALYIASKQRSLKLEDVIHTWVKANIFNTYIVVEEEDVEDYKMELSRLQVDISILVLPLSNRGIAFARQFILIHAIENKFKAIIQADDDFLLADNLSQMFEAVINYPRIGGFGCFFPNYSFYLKMDADSGVNILRSGLGVCVTAGNPKLWLQLGGYDNRLLSHEDYWVRFLLLENGFPWAIHTDVCCKQKGKYKADGGVTASIKFSGYDGFKTFKRFQERWGELYIKHYVSEKKCRVPMRIKWKKIHEFYLVDDSYYLERDI